MTRMSMRCGICGSENVMRDAWAEWDATSQAWFLGSVFDAAFCNDCEADATIAEQPLSIGITVLPTAD